MQTIDEFTKACQNAMPQELASAVNLMAHPFAGMAAAGAIGMGLAGHAFGMWMGAVAGAAEASQKLFDGLAETDKTQAQPKTKLRLVASQPAPDRAPVTRKTAMAKPAMNERSPSRDDLKAISGIGPKLEKVLNDLGIWTYAQIAALDKAQIERLDGQLGFSGRIGRDDWIGQAAALAAGGK